MNNRSQIYHQPVGYKNDPRRFFIDWIEDGSIILDLGCACGDFAVALKTEKANCKIYGMEFDQESCITARKSSAFEDVYNVDLELFSPNAYDKIFGSFDYLTFGDVLEHLRNPINAIRKLKVFLKPEGKILISLPNIAHKSIKAQLLKNSFSYTDVGLLDRTHLRFFAPNSIKNFLEESRINLLEIKNTYVEDNECYTGLPLQVQEYIENDKCSHIFQFVMKCDLNFSTQEYGLLKNLYSCVSCVRARNYFHKKFLQFVSCFIPNKNLRRRIRNI